MVGKSRFFRPGLLACSAAPAFCLLAMTIKGPSCSGAGGDSGGGGGAVLAPLTVHWGQWRGLEGSGVSTAANVPDDWDGATSRNILWKSAVPLDGASSPVVLGDRVVLTGADATTREVYCYDANTGLQLWRRSVTTATSPSQNPVFTWPSSGAPITFAGPTPATDGIYIYALFGNGDCASIDYEGNQKWAVNIGLPQNTYGHSSSLILSGGRLLIQYDQGYAINKSAIIALDTANGSVAWTKTGAIDRPVSEAWSTPVVVNTGSRNELIASGNPMIIAYDPATGAELWRTTPIIGGNVGASPVPIGADVLISASTGGTLRLPTGGSGSAVAPSWATAGTGSEVASPLADAGNNLVFGMQSGYPSKLICLDAAGGTVLWSQALDDALWGGMLGITYYASPVMAGGNLYLLSQTGVTFVVAADASGATLLRTNRLDSAESYYCSPAIAPGRIFILSTRFLYGIWQ
jgi:outer membrane protein assembly factor BamB